MADPCTVLIAAADLLPALKERGFEDGGELLAFSDTDALRALDVISRRRPRVVALEQTFAATPRGAALINRIKADPTLSGSAIRVVAVRRRFARRRAGGRGQSRDRADPRDGAAPASAAVVIPAQPLDKRGTRRAPRYAIAGAVEVIVDGNRATLVDLSTIGAQVLSPTILKPNQKRADDDRRPADHDALQCDRRVGILRDAAEDRPALSRGIEFLDANAADIDAYRLRLTGPAEPL